MTQQIPLQTLLGDRYKVTALNLETSDGDAVFDGLDQILNRKVSIVVAAPANAPRLVANARKSAALSRSTVQVLDLGNYKENTYLVTSRARPDILLDTLLTEGGGEAEAFGEEIFGDTGTLEAPNTYVVARETSEDGEQEPVGETSASSRAAFVSVTRAATLEEPVEAEDEYEEYDAEEDGYYEGEESSEGTGGKWVVGIAAVLLLVIGAGAVFASLSNMVDTDASQKALGGSSASTSTPASSSTSASAAASPTENKLAAPALQGNFTRTVPSNPSQMSGSDGSLSNMSDGNPATTWLSLSFASADFGGLFTNFYFTGQLKEATTVNAVTINQVSGTGGSFTVLAGESNNIDQAKEVGSGTFAASGETTVELDKDAQGGKTEYIFIRFDSAPTLSQPIVAGYPYGLRIAEISVK